MADGPFAASFFCSSCSAPIRLDSSLLDSGSLFEAVAPFIDDPTRQSVASASSSAAPTGAPSINDSFIVLPPATVTDDKTNSSAFATRPTPSAGAPSTSIAPAPPTSSAFATSRGSLSHRLRVASRLFDLVAAASTTSSSSAPSSSSASGAPPQIDHPLCADCADEITLKLEKRLAEARKERDAYAAYLAKMSAASGGGVAGGGVESGGASAARAKEVEELEDRERKALVILRELEREAGAVKEELTSVESELKDLEAAEASYWNDVNILQEQMKALEDERDSVTLKYEYAMKQLERLEKTNVYNDTFRIWHDGPFGTINGFRLGRLPNQPVEWSEINAALGQTMLLLDTLATKLGFTFKTYKLVPMGSFSRIEKIEGDKAVYELYGSGDLSGILFWNRRFENGLVAFLNCLQQLGDFAAEQDPKFRLPYRINKDKIGDASIRVQFGQDDQWTKALKYTLIDTKWLLAFAVVR
ncbi:autophagy protein Apg6-domain-containing protein [Zopfochytrium polystomum]|nr:autophagy protein Apg6-domain-containing protein [Zopfochytrium polystomum]